MPEKPPRSLWVSHLVRMVGPVLAAAAERRLRRDMPVEARAGAEKARRKFTHLEAVGRSLVGAAPFLELGEDAEARRLAPVAREAVRNLLDPASPDHVDFTAGHQIIVDTAFLAQAFLRAPRALWEPLDTDSKQWFHDAVVLLRTRAPYQSNWLLFAAMAEALCRRTGRPWDPMRVDYALRQHEQWYVGGGWYKDGASFHHDYYNAFVIQPMLLDVAEASDGCDDPLGGFVRSGLPAWRSRARRFAEIQERQIAPDGSFPVTGRSIAYRGGAFQHLAMMALRRELPETVAPAQARVALTAVLRRTLEAPDTYDPAGFLRIGLAGHQPSLGEDYISTGSLYLASAAFLPLGLPASEPFWSAPDVPTTWMKAWSGVDLPADHD